MRRASRRAWCTGAWARCARPPGGRFFSRLRLNQPEATREADARALEVPAPKKRERRRAKRRRGSRPSPRARTRAGISRGETASTARCAETLAGRRGGKRRDARRVGDRVVVRGHQNDIYGSASRSHVHMRSYPLRAGAALGGHLADELAHLLALLLAATVGAELLRREKGDRVSGGLGREGLGCEASGGRAATASRSRPSRPRLVEDTAANTRDERASSRADDRRARGGRIRPAGSLPKP